jgi:hypothetical protein
MARKCPPGVLCLSNSVILVLIFIALCAIGAMIYLKGDSSKTVVHVPQRTMHAPIQPPSPPMIINAGGDDRYTRAPQPLRSWMNPPEFPPRGGIASIPINIPTQGLPESFQSVGMINVNGEALPLYGRRTAGSSDRWNYYTRTDTYNPVPVPIKFGKRDCMDDVGCNEVSSGDNVHLDGLHKHGKVNIYKLDGPKYIPGLL